MRRHQIVDGVWFPWEAMDRHECCECGLTHDVDIKCVKGKLYMRWRRNERSTAAVRRAKCK